MTDPSVIDRMDGHKFEYYCAELLKRNGFRNVRVTPGSGDQGVDILAERDNTSYAIQCKCYRGKVGNKAVQEALSGRIYYGCNVAIVLTNSYFTEHAKDAARKTGVLLWDRDTLLAFDRVAYPFNAALKGTFGQSAVVEKKNSGRWLLRMIIIAAFVIGIVWIADGGLSSKHKMSQEGVENVVIEKWSTPELDDFEYEYEDGGIRLKEYKGEATSIIIPDSYEVEGHQLPVLKLESTFQDKKDIVNLVIPEGVEYIDSNTFEGKGRIRHIFLPSTMTGSASVLKDFIDGEILYYGGTEEQWHELCFLVGRSQITFKQIIFEAKAEDCIENINKVIEEPSDDIDEKYASLSDFGYDVAYGKITLVQNSKTVIEGPPQNQYNNIGT